MKQSTPPALRRTAAVGATVALVAVSTMIGFGTSAAVADTSDTTGTSGTATSVRTGADTAAPQPTEPAADSSAADSRITTSSATPSDGTPADEATVDETPASDSATDETADDEGTEQDAEPADGTAPDDAVPSTGTQAVDPSEDPEAADDETPAAVTPITWAEATTPDEPLSLEAPSGEAFSHTFRATGGDGPLEYLFNPLSGVPGDVTWNEQTGVLSGTPTTSALFPFEVTATDGHHSAVQYVNIWVPHGTPTKVMADVATGQSGLGLSWVIADGTIQSFKDGSTVAAIPARQGDSFFIHAYRQDAAGNAADGPNGPEDPRPVVTSSVAGDLIEWVPGDHSWKITFTHASPHDVAVAVGNLSTGFRFDVSPVASPAPVRTTDTTTISTGTGTGTDTDTGTLAYTGADESGAVGWALGLLATGAGLLTWRLRRRLR